MIKMRCLFLIGLLMLALGGGAVYAAGAEVVSVDNSSYTGENIVFGADSCIVYRGVTPTEVLYNNIAGIMILSELSPAVKSPVRITTVNNDILMGKIDGGQKGKLLFSSPVIGQVELQYSAVKSIEMAVNKFFISEPGDTEEDMVYLLSGDKDRGAVTLLDSDRLVVKSSLYNKELSYKLADVGRVEFMSSPVLNKPDRPGFETTVLCRDGSRITGYIEGSKSHIGLKTRYNINYSIPLDRIIFVYFPGSRCRYLSDETPSIVKEYAWTFAQDDMFLWPYQRDRGVRIGKGEPKNISIKGAEYPKGLGVHANSELTYKFAEFTAGKSDGQYQTFYATIGLDDSAEDKASVQFVIYLDGVKAYESKVFKSGDGPEEIAIPLNKTKEMKLVVTDVGDGYVHDRAVWALARVIRP
ncbi:MAG: NPCBM/NEW2 domain-containing protein [Candidatus Brocadiia bacterium]